MLALVLCSQFRCYVWVVGSSLKEVFPSISIAKIVSFLPPCFSLLPSLPSFSLRKILWNLYLQKKGWLDSLKVYPATKQLRGGDAFLGSWDVRKISNRQSKATKNLELKPKYHSYPIKKLMYCSFRSVVKSNVNPLQSKSFSIKGN